MFLCFLYNAFSFHTFHFFFHFPLFYYFPSWYAWIIAFSPYSLHLFHSYIYIPLLFLDFSSVHPLALLLLSNLCFTSFSPLSYHLYHSVSVPQSSSLTFSSTSLLLVVSPSLCPSHYHSVPHTTLTVKVLPHIILLYVQVSPLTGCVAGCGSPPYLFMR